MANPELKNYIRKTLKQGYTLQSIQKRLIQSGYSQKEIRQAIQDTQKKKILSPKTLGLAAGIIIILIILTITGIKILTPEPKTIQASTTPLVSTVTPGGKITFVTTLTSPNTKTIQTSIQHRVLSKKTGKQIATKTETAQVKQKSSSQTQITIPDNTETGEYEIITQIKHKYGSAQSQFNFLVEKPSLLEQKIQEPEQEQPTTCPQGCDDYNKCTEDKCVNGICQHTPIIPCCGNLKCEQGEDEFNCPEDCKKTTQTTQQTIEQAIITARTDQGTATMLCNSLPSVEDADQCFATLSDKTNQPEFCKSIQNTEFHDTCLIDYAIQGNFEVCEQMEDIYYIQSCYSLQRQAGIEEMIKEYS